MFIPAERKHFGKRRTLTSNRNKEKTRLEENGFEKKEKRDIRRGKTYFLHGKDAPRKAEEDVSNLGKTDGRLRIQKEKRLELTESLSIETGRKKKLGEWRGSPQRDKKTMLRNKGGGKGGLTTPEEIPSLIIQKNLKQA